MTHSMLQTHAGRELRAERRLLGRWAAWEGGKRVISAFRVARWYVNQQGPGALLRTCTRPAAAGALAWASKLSKRACTRAGQRATRRAMRDSTRAALATVTGKLLNKYNQLALFSHLDEVVDAVASCAAAQSSAEAARSSSSDTIAALGARAVRVCMAARVWVSFAKRMPMRVCTFWRVCGNLICRVPREALPRNAADTLNPANPAPLDRPNAAQRKTWAGVQPRAWIRCMGRADWPFGSDCDLVTALRGRGSARASRDARQGAGTPQQVLCARPARSTNTNPCLSVELTQSLYRYSCTPDAT